MDFSLLYLVAVAVGFYLAWAALDALRWDAFMQPGRSSRGLVRLVLALVVGWTLGNALFGFLQALLAVWHRATFRF
ncbi:MAG: DUF1146 family protein [bacterium]|nr:DUF1146 family protein [bacterium]